MPQGKPLDNVPQRKRDNHINWENSHNPTNSNLDSKFITPSSRRWKAPVDAKEVMVSSIP
ncbi:MAG: hypothetical protein WBG73_10490 [Coleofasciculaceae cyanobacterium]